MLHLTENIYFNAGYIHYVNNLDICPCQGFFYGFRVFHVTVFSCQVTVFYHRSIMHIISVWNLHLFIFNEWQGKLKQWFVTYWGCPLGPSQLWRPWLLSAIWKWIISGSGESMGQAPWRCLFRQERHHCETWGNTRFTKCSYSVYFWDTEKSSCLRLPENWYWKGGTAGSSLGPGNWREATKSLSPSCRG